MIIGKYMNVNISVFLRTVSLTVSSQLAVVAPGLDRVLTELIVDIS